MKISFVLFTYRNDEPLLPYALQSLARLCEGSGHEITVNLYDDEAAPLESVPPCDHYARTNFPRGNNLTCFGAIDGMLRVYQEVAERDQPDWVVKMDCDTMMTGFGWLEGAHPKIGMIGCCPFKNITHVCGFYYALNPEIIGEMLALVNREDIKTRILAGPQFEDKTFTLVAKMLRPVSVALNPTNQPGVIGAGCQWFADGKYPITDFLASAAVTFKRPGKTPEIIEEARGGMEAFWELLKDKPVRLEPAEGENGIIPLSKAKICALVDRLGKTAAFFGWLQSSALLFTQWQALDVLPYHPEAHNDVLDSLLAVLGISAEEATPLIEELKV